MTRKTFRVLHAVLGAGLAIAAVCAVTLHILWILVVAVVCATGLNYLLRKATKEVMNDERTSLLYEKAAGATLRLTMPIAAIASVVLLVLNDRISDDATLIAYVLSYAVCILLLVHLAFYSYYSRKH
ncbi:MAG: DUF2178 domain-containing protein [Dehalococcoidia bacterium]|nr:DUF2178 domain-containing protein [Dehalococcoidia bacterium]